MLDDNKSQSSNNFWMLKGTARNDLSNSEILNFPPYESAYSTSHLFSISIGFQFIRTRSWSSRSSFLLSEVGEEHFKHLNQRFRSDESSLCLALTLAAWFIPAYCRGILNCQTKTQKKRLFSWL